ncbi:MAG: aminoacyl-tRNA hydrolase [bacterium]
MAGLALKAVVGLGNPGRKYVGTPHNLGFEVVEELARRSGGKFRASRRVMAELAEVSLSGQTLVLVKPLTYVNLSGEGVGPLARKDGWLPEEVLAISDDLHLGLGQLRLRMNGTSGGHKGLISLEQFLGSQDFPRLRLGCKTGEVIEGWADFVLGRFGRDEKPIVEEMIGRAADAVECLVKDGLETAMNIYNRRPKAEEEEE